MILDAFGRLARRQSLPLLAPAVRALVDGQQFLRGVADVLPAIRVEPYCRVCLGSGGTGAVTVDIRNSLAEFRCTHTAGYVRLDRELEVEPLLLALSWGLRCKDCGGAVTGDNGKTDLRFRVECSCTIREMVNPLATKTTGPLG